MRKDIAVVFDMDGVIFDTEKLVLKAWQTVAQKHHIPDIEQMVERCLGLNQDMAKQRFCEHYGEDFPYFELKKETRALFFGPYYGEHLPIKPGVVELLSALKSQEVPVALATSTREELVHKELEDASLKQYFDAIICGDMVAHSKPHPEIFLHACEELGVPPHNAFGVEDSFNGIRAVHAGKLKAVMIPDMLQPTEEILPLLTICCKDMGEFHSYLKEQGWLV